MRKKHKGTSLVEVVVSFALISLTLGLGMAGISCGAHFMNEGARLKNENRQNVLRELQTAGMYNTNSYTITIRNKDGSVAQHVNVTESEAHGFKRYKGG